ncbi:MAG: hypothetical protein H0W88_08095 [Parachlamydiaceae bacterium]|nr:hypothetical protein [Parachlamydiaceae bacterium]
MGAIDGRLGKGLAEADTQLPIQLNLALQDLLSKQPNFFYAGPYVKTAYNYGDTYQKVVSLINYAVTPAMTESKKWFYRPFEPEMIKLPEDKNLHPNFEKCLAAKEFEDPLYGKVTAKVFPSNDNNLQFLFYEVEDKRAFLIGIERVKNNPINCYGVRKQAENPQGLDAPLLEYEGQIPLKNRPMQCPGPVYKQLNNKYMNNWNFIRKLEIIQLYYKDLRIEIPAEV